MELPSWHQFFYYRNNTGVRYREQYAKLSLQWYSSLGPEPCVPLGIWPSMSLVSYLRPMGYWGLSCCSCGHLSTLFVWLGGFCHAQRRLGPLRSSGCCLSSKSLHPRLGVGMEKVWLPIFSAFVEDRNGNVAWSELGVYRVAFSSRQQPGAFTGRAIGRGCRFLK